MANPVLFTNIAFMHFPGEHDFDYRGLCQYVLVERLNPITYLAVKSICEQRSSASDALTCTMISVRSCTYKSHLIPLFRLVNKQRIKCNWNKTCEDVMNPIQAVKSYLKYTLCQMCTRFLHACSALCKCANWLCRTYTPHHTVVGRSSVSLTQNPFAFPSNCRCGPPLTSYMPGLSNPCTRARHSTTHHRTLCAVHSLCISALCNDA
jgi:hypothetical protein